MSGFVKIDSALYDSFVSNVTEDQARYEALLKNTSISGLPDNDRALIIFEYFFLNVK
jgi:DNA-binding transcriptional regulator YbjK